MSLNACSTYIGVSNSLPCNPALFSSLKQQGIFVNLLGKAHGDSIETGKHLLLNPITECSLRELFGKSYYNSFTFSSKSKYENYQYGKEWDISLGTVQNGTHIVPGVNFYANF